MPEYGTMLSAFPELLRDYTVFKMPPYTGAGYGERYDKRAVTGYMSWRKAREMGIVGGTTVRNDRGTFWEQCNGKTGESVIEEGDFIEINNKIFKFVEGDDFSAEGGFARWTVQYVAGNTDQQYTNTKVDEAVRGDYE
jgi:hypothetical protein